MCSRNYIWQWYSEGCLGPTCGATVSWWSAVSPRSRILCHENRSVLTQYYLVDIGGTAIGPGRALVEDRVAGRAAHESAESVKDTCSFARAERLLGREYHGRFLIELLQNAADAWRRTAAPGTRSELRIVVDPVGPALVVANCGVEFPAEVVFDSLGQIGSSTKPAGEAIGHKGIGFKSVLEVSRAPELYSGFTGSDPHPVGPVRRPRRSAADPCEVPDWDQFLKDIADIHHPIEAIPILRYPIWVESPPAIVPGARRGRVHHRGAPAVHRRG